MENRRRVAAILVGMWGLISTLYALALWVQEDLTPATALIGAGVYHGLLFAAAVPLWRVLQGLARRRLSPALSLIAHGAVLTAALALWLGVYLAFLYATAGPESFFQTIRTAGWWLLLQSLITYTVLVTSILSLQSVIRLEAQRRRASDLRALAQQAELRALRAQLRPHFLFNVLNSIYALIPTAPDNAQLMVERVADLLRETMDVTDQTLIPLEEELRLVDRYLDIETLRLGDRLSVERDVDPAVLSWPVPPLILQPLVENAIKHGIGRRARPGTIGLGARRFGSTLEVRIRNEGPDGPAGTGRGGKGLSITRHRLETMYGEEGLLDLDRRGARFEVRVMVPRDA